MLRLVRLLLPVLFPSWRFFETIGPSPRIEVRTGPDMPWTSIAGIPQRLSVAEYMRRIVYNPASNRRLYLISTAVRHAIEPSDWVKSELDREVFAHVDPACDELEYRVLFKARQEGQIGVFVDFERGVVRRALSM